MDITQRWARVLASYLGRLNCWLLSVLTWNYVENQSDDSCLFLLLMLADPSVD